MVSRATREREKKREVPHIMSTNVKFNDAFHFLQALCCRKFEKMGGSLLPAVHRGGREDWYRGGQEPLPRGVHIPGPSLL